MKSTKVVSWILTGMLLAILLAACNSTGNAGFPTGKFVRSDNKDHGFVFKDGAWTVFDGGSTLVNAKYTVNGDVFTETSNDQNCPDPMHFKYVFDGTKLTFNYVAKPADDPCDGRRGDMNNVTYVLSK